MIKKLFNALKQIINPKPEYHQCECGCLTVFNGDEIWKECANCGSYDLTNIGYELPF